MQSNRPRLQLSGLPGIGKSQERITGTGIVVDRIGELLSPGEERVLTKTVSFDHYIKQRNRLTIKKELASQLLGQNYCEQNVYYFCFPRELNSEELRRLRKFTNKDGKIKIGIIRDQFTGKIVMRLKKGKISHDFEVELNS